VFDILDTAGQEEYSAMREQWFRTSEGFYFVYSITSRSDFDSLIPTMAQLVRVKDVNSPTQLPIVLVGNKCDLGDNREVSTAEGVVLAQKWGSPFFETSAKLNININESFEEMYRQIKRLRVNERKD